MCTTAASVGLQGTHIQASTHICAHTRTHTHTNTRMRTHTHTQTQTRANVHRLAQHMHTHKHTHTYKRPNTQAHTCTHTHAHTHTCTHAYTFTCCARDGLRQFFSIASDAPTLELFILVEEIYGTRYQRGSFSLINVNLLPTWQIWARS